MVNILFNRYDIDAKWCFSAFQRYIKATDKVVIIPFSFRDERVNSKNSWEAYYGQNDGIYYNGIVNSFFSYGIQPENIIWINYFTDSKESAIQKISNSDILYFTGGLPDKMMIRLKEFDLISTIENHNGIIMGYSAGAMIQIKNYHITPDKDYTLFGYYKGLKLIDIFDIEVHFEHSDLQISSIETVRKETGLPVYAIEDNGAVLVDDGKITTVGNVHYYK